MVRDGIGIGLVYWVNTLVLIDESCSTLSPLTIWMNCI